jgi:endoglucanase
MKIASLMSYAKAAKRALSTVSLVEGKQAAATARRFRPGQGMLVIFGLMLLGVCPAIGNEDEAARYNRLLGRGVNLGNALDAPSGANWALRLKGEYFQTIKKAGFDSVRIPVAWSLHAAGQPPYAIDPSFLAKVDWAIDQSLSQGLAVVLDVHHDVDMERQPDQGLPRLTAIWAQLGQHYRAYSDKLYFELLNEPSGALSDAKWQDAMLSVLHTVRETNPTRMVVIGPGYWNSLDHLGNLQLPPDDRRIIVTFHYYVPLRFTHQGAPWMPGSDKWMGATWTGVPQERAVLDRDFDKAAAWAARNSRPLYLGEFGAFQAGDMDSRANWTHAVAEAASQRGFSFAYWEFGSTFGVYDPVAMTWRAPLLAALIGSPR